MQKFIIEDPTKATEFLQSYDFSTVSFDAETRGVKWYDRWCHGGSYENGDPTGISFCNGTQAVYIDTCGWTEEEFHRVADVLHRRWQDSYKKAKGKTIIAHNIPFDMGCLYKYGLKLWGAEWFCTMTAAHLLDENRPKSLKHLAGVLLGKEETVPWNEARKDKAIFHEYALNDAIWTWELAQIFSKQMQHQNLDKLFREIEMPYQLCLMQMEINGVKVDLERVHRISDELEQASAETEIEMLEFIGEPYEICEEIDGPTRIKSDWNFNSSQQLAIILFDRLRLEVIERSKKTGAPSTGKATLLHHKDNEFVQILRKYKVIRKLLSSFFKPLPELTDPDGRVRPSFRNTGTVTGRLSCSEPNLQQLPKPDDLFRVNTRACFIADEGYKMVACDFSQQETRIMAHLSEDPTLISIILNGGDMHMFSANNVFSLGIPEEKLYDKHPEHLEIRKQYAAERNKGKIFSFGIPYGMTEHKAAKDFNITPEEGKVLMDNFFSGFPLLQKAIDKTHQLAQEQTYVTTYTGRRRRFFKNQWGRLDQSALRQSFNFLIQSFGADLMRIASIKCLKYSAKHPEMKIKQVMSVHDELVFLVKEEYAEQFREDVEKIFESSWDLCVPLKATADVGNDYGEVK